MFQHAYLSPWHHPLFAFCAAIVTLLVLAVRRPVSSLRAFGALLVVESAVDAFCTGAWSPLPKSSGWTGVIAFLFVILGDLRFLFLVERQPQPASLRRDLNRGQAAAVALGIAMLVPLLVGALMVARPVTFSTEQNLYLAYELAFVGIVLAVIRRVRSTHPEGPMRRWLLVLCGLELVQYGTWALADILVLTVGDAGYALRFLPNGIYYGAFTLVAVYTAPAEAVA